MDVSADDQWQLVLLREAVVLGDRHVDRRFDARERRAEVGSHLEAVGQCVQLADDIRSTVEEVLHGAVEVLH